jgi:glyoxylase-like metal-dependent hydrolase (beta-lactamase superfamily II)
MAQYQNYVSPTRRGVLRLAGGAASFAALGAALPTAAQAAAPMLGVLRPQVYRFKIGSFEVTNILDGFRIGDGPHPIFGNNQPAEAVQAYAKANGLPSTKVETPFTNTIVNTGKELVLFDTGNGKARMPTAGKLQDLLVTAGYKPEQVDIVVISHGHPDHIGGLMEGEGGKPTYPNARYVFSEVEFDYWKKGENIAEARKPNREQFMKVAVPFAEKATFLKGDAEVISGIRSVPTFGHSPGHMAFHVENGGQRLLIWADVANHYIMSLQQPDWHVAFDHDKEAGAATRKRVFDMVSNDQVAVVGYHMPFPSLGWVEKSGTSYRWVPASYQFNL